MTSEIQIQLLPFMTEKAGKFLRFFIDQTAESFSLKPQAKSSPALGSGKHSCNSLG